MMVNVLVRFRAAVRLKVLAVPHYFFAGAKCDISEKHCFCERAGIIKIASRRPAMFARFEPFLVMAN